MYGFDRGDEFITALARSLHRAVVAAGLPPAFLGHIGGDDFVIVCTPDQVRPLTERAVVDFEKAADELYDPSDAAARLRRGAATGAATSSARPWSRSPSGWRCPSADRRFTDPREVIAVASEMKTVGQEPARLVRGRRPAPVED